MLSSFAGRSWSLPQPERRVRRRLRQPMSLLLHPLVKAFPQCSISGVFPDRDRSGEHCVEAIPALSAGFEGYCCAVDFAGCRPVDLSDIDLRRRRPTKGISFLAYCGRDRDRELVVSGRVVPGPGDGRLRPLEQIHTHRLRAIGDGESFSDYGKASPNAENLFPGRAGRLIRSYSNMLGVSPNWSTSTVASGRGPEDERYFIYSNFRLTATFPRFGCLPASFPIAMCTAAKKQP